MQNSSGCYFVPTNSPAGEAETIQREKAWCAKVCAAADDCGPFQGWSECIRDDSTGFTYAAKAECTPWAWYVLGGLLLLALCVVASWFGCRVAHRKLMVHATVMVQQQAEQVHVCPPAPTIGLHDATIVPSTIVQGQEVVTSDPWQEPAKPVQLNP